MPVSIINFLEVQKDENILRELREIFFESSNKKKIKVEEEKNKLFWKYLGFYLATYPEYAWIAKKEKVLGYIVMAPHTATPALFELQSHLKFFKPCYEKFPAHIHLNCHVEARGQGIGSDLINVVVKKLQELSISGLHIVTTPDARNCNFYKKLGFNFENNLSFHGFPLLFMGKNLS